jgi:protein-S-isoprenylcysteine O-methyltransferase Ste14
MEFFPELKIGLFNGWLPLVLFSAVFGILLAIFPKSVVSRLYERSGWTRSMRLMRAFGLIFIFSWFILAIFTPLKADNLVFITGGSIYALGLICFVIALFNYRDTPLDRPVTKGLYKISRNPQHVTLFLSFLGISIAIGSWIATLLISIGIVLGHMRILTEEKACLEQYGDAFKSYMEQAPRYFVFF